MPVLAPAAAPLESAPLAPRVVPELDPSDPRADERLAPVLDLVERRDVSVLSLDFFDTLSGRAVPSPPLAFRRVGEVLRASGLLPRGFDPAAFVAVRIAAERRARARASARGRGTEVRLAEIYAELPEALLAPTHRARAAALEVKVEGALAIPDPAVLAVARRAKARGLKVVVTSDTYLAPEDLLAILRAGGAAFAPDLVLTSSQAGTCKADRLFGVLVARLGLAPERIAHLGDNYEADVLGARRAGVRAFHFPQGDPALRHARAREDALSLDGPAADGGLAFLRAHAAARAGVAPSDLADAFRLGATVFGPVFAGFADWVADQVAAHRCGGAVFFMREGAFLAELVEHALAARGEQRRCAPLWISRQAAFRASVATLDEAVIRDALARRTRPTAAELCATFGVAPDEVGLAGPRGRAPLESEATVSHAVAALLRPEAKGRIEDALREQRTLLRAHLAEAAPFPGPVACVDLGWGGTIQRLLARALVADEAPRPLVGLYLATTPRVADVTLDDGGLTAGYLASPGRADRVAELIGRSPEVLEQLCLPPVGSVIGYVRAAGGRPAPVLDTYPPDPAGDRSRAAVRAGILHFQATHLRLARRAHGRIPAETARAILVRLLASPSPAEARLLGSWRHDDNFGTSAGGEIAPRRPTSEVETAPPAALFDDRSLYWPAAVAARTSARAADAFTAYALLGLFGPGAPPGADALETPLRYRIADQLDGIVRRWAPGVRKRLRRAAVERLRLAEPVVPPLRYRAVDAVNDAAKRVVPGLHGRSKRLAAGALGVLARAEGRLLATARSAFGGGG
jgi:FMN phosphatase YigB (HAD superfamily)